MEIGISTVTFPVIDVHVHIHPYRKLASVIFEQMRDARENYPEILAMMDDPGKFLAHLDREGIAAAGLINYPSPESFGFDATVNDWVVDYAKAAPHRFICYGGVHAPTVKDAAAEMGRILKLGVQAIKVHPQHQGHAANAYTDGLKPLREVYEAAQAARIPVTVHTGTSVFQGVRNKYGDPIALDDVGVDFPELRVVVAHGGRPIWMETAFFLVRRFPNFYLEISGIPPQNLLQYFPKLESVADRVLWGSDWPSMGVKGMRANVEKFLELPLRDDTREKILYRNASRLWPHLRTG